MIIRDEDKCTHCGVCEMVLCPSGNAWKSVDESKCIGCKACLMACPQEALKENHLKNFKSEKTVFVNSKKIKSSGFIKDALKDAGVKISSFPYLIPNISQKDNSENVCMPCLSGSCWSCAVKVDGKYALSCLTPLYDDMKIKLIEEPPSIRVVSGFGAHTVGGVGTPYYLKNTTKPIEIACFTHGCNLYCPQCQNYQMAFTAGGHLMDDSETAITLLGLQRQYNVNRIAISGGESTLNPTWLIKVIKTIRETDQDVHIHVDTNGTVLTPAYIDDLVRAGMTEVGIDLKSISTSTFMDITNITNEKMAKNYLKTSWAAVKYIIDNYHQKLFIGIGIPYNKELISKEEVVEMGRQIVNIDDEVQVCLLDYRGEFRRKGMILPSYNEMMEVKNILNETGLKTVIAQTTEGHIGP